MRTAVIIGLVAIIGSIAVDGYGLTNNPRRRGPPHSGAGIRFPHGPQAPLREPDEPHRWPEGPHGHPVRPRGHPEGPFGHPEGPHGRPEGPHGHPVGQYGRLERPHGHPEGPRVRPEGPRRRPDGPRGRLEGPHARPNETHGRPGSKGPPGNNRRRIPSHPSLQPCLDTVESSAPSSGPDSGTSSYSDSSSGSGSDSRSDSSGSSSSSERQRRPGRGPCCTRCTPRTTRPPWTRTPFTRSTTPKPNDFTNAWWETKRPATRTTSRPWPTRTTNTAGWWQPTTTSRPTTIAENTPRTTVNWWATMPTLWSTRGPTKTEAPTTTTTEKVTPSTTMANPTQTPETTPTSQNILDCITICPSTPEYNPVCGTNGETYGNIGKLLCAKHCGLNVELKRNSACPPPLEPEDEGGDGGGANVTPPPTTTSSPAFGRTTSLTSFQKCMKQCPITPTFSPICGTDFETYINIDRMKCAQGCGIDVQVLCESPCGVCRYGIQTTIPTTSTTSTAIPVHTTTSGNVGRTTVTVSMEQCISSCPTGSHYNPICGTNNVNYTNPTHLLCVQMCGSDVKAAKFGACTPVSTTEPLFTITDNDYEDVTLSSGALACIRRCPVTSEYNPVCGTNQETYTNPGRLECAKYCGVLVKLDHEGPCNGLETTPSSSPGGRGTPSWSTTTTTTTSRPTSSTVNEDDLDFTIAPDILSSIFGNVPTQRPTTTTTTTTSMYDDDVSIDPRFGNDSEEKEYRRELKDASRIIFPE